MRVLCLPATWPKLDGCSAYRMVWPAQALIAEGHDIVIGDQLIGVMERGLYADRLIGAKPIDFDVVVVQRTLRPDMLVLLGSLQEQGVAVVIDLDDDVAAVHPEHIAHRKINPKTSPDGSSWQVTRELCRIADMVTVSTPALARKYAPHGRCKVIRNAIRRSWLSDGPSSGTYLGWTGTPRTHVHDLDVARGAVLRVVSEGTPFLAIGNALTLEVLGIAGEVSPWCSLEGMDYPEQISRLALGMVPLLLSPFNGSKSAIKGCEYSARGVPFVASPTSEYRLLAQTGAGLLARNEREWVWQLRRLAANADLRATLAAQAQAVVAQRTIEGSMAAEVWAAWRRAAEHRARVARSVAVA